MVSANRFVVETVEITDCDTDESRIAKVITDTNELYSYDDLYELSDDLNKLAEENEKLKEEDARLNQVIINLHDDLRKLTEQNRKLQNIVIWQQEIIQNYNELMQIVSSD